MDYNATMKTMEQPGISDRGREHNVAKLEQFLKETADRYRTEGVPLGDDGRIDISQYKELYSGVAHDLDSDRREQQEKLADLSISEAQEKRFSTKGEQLEMLACAILAKNLGEEFIVVRASRHDDRFSNVDTIILDKQTGDLVCAFDEVGAHQVQYMKRNKCS